MSHVIVSSNANNFEIVVAAINLAVATTISVFVSDGNGSDTAGDGSLENPYKTIGKARDYIRTLTKNSGDSIFVEIRGGKYSLTEALTFGSQDSGMEGSPITYRAYQGEEVLIIGGTTIGGWTSVTDQAILDRLKTNAKTNVKVASLGSLDMGTIVRRGLFVPGGYAAMELFFKNEPMTLARYPNTDFMTISDLTDLTITFVPADNNLAQWQQEPDPHAFGYWQFQWADEYTSLSGIQGQVDQVSATLGYTPVFGITKGSRFYLLNFLSELDAPGEYYIDRNNSKIYFWPPTGDFEQADVVVSVLDYVIKMDQASYINFEGLTIEASRKEGVYGTSISDVTLNGLTVRNTGTNSITITDSSNILIERCLVENSGETAVSLSGGERASLTKANITARNNVVRNFSRWCKTYNPAFKVDGVGVTIEHNEMYNGPHNALWWFGNYHTFQYNVIHDVCKETQDVGAIYSVRDWTYRGTVIKHNLFYDITGYKGEGAVGVYMDDQCSSAEIFGNIFYNVTTAIKIGGGRDNLVHNNIIIEALYAVWIDSRGTGACGPMNNASLYATLEEVPINSEVWATAFPELASIYSNDPPAPAGNKLGTNIIMNATNEYFLCTQQSVSPYLTFSDDCSLSLSDFVDAYSLNFTLKAGAIDKCTSDAFKQAFKEIPVDMIGVMRLPAPPVAPASAPGVSNTPGSGNAPKAQISSAGKLSFLYASLLAMPLLF